VSLEKRLRHTLKYFKEQYVQMTQARYRLFLDVKKPCKPDQLRSFGAQTARPSG